MFNLAVYVRSGVVSRGQLVENNDRTLVVDRLDGLDHIAYVMCCFRSFGMLIQGYCYRVIVTGNGCVRMWKLMNLSIRYSRANARDRALPIYATALWPLTVW